MGLFKKKQSNVPRRRLDGSGVTQDTSSNMFKRNRTLTGTTSNHFDSTNVKSDLESPRTHAHNLTIQRRKVLSIFIFVILSAGLLFTLISNFTAIVSINLADTAISKTIDSSYYVKAIQEYLDVNPMSRFRFLLDQSSLATYISSKLPEVVNVEQQNTFGVGQTGFVVTMRRPVAGWVIDGKQYYVDSKGVAFEKNYFLAPTVQIVDESGASIQTTTGTAIVSKRFLSFVGRVVSLSKSNGYTVTEAILPAGTTRELEVRLKEGNYLVKLSIDRPVGEQIEDMSRAVKFFSGRGQVPSYIDIRVSGKAFYI